MGNIDTYVKKTGQKTFDQEPFNNVDNLIISYLVYYDFRGIVPTPGQGGDLSVAQAALQYNKRVGDSQKTVRPILLKDMAESVRFKDMRLSARVDIFAKGKTQFSALCVKLPDGTPYYVFRGIDYSVTGWKEAFQTSYMETPAQKMAAKYLNRLLSKGKLPDKILTGGHSKGGNLALYAAVHQKKEYRDRIRTIYQNDAPGLAPGSYKPEILAEFKGRVKRFSPEFLLIDSLFKDSYPNRIIRSEYKGFNQHEPFSWIVEGTDFVDAPQADPAALMLKDIISDWIRILSPKECEAFIRRFFGVWQKAADEGKQMDIAKTEDLLKMVVRTWVGASVPARKAVIKFVKCAAEAVF